MPWKGWCTACRPAWRRRPASRRPAVVLLRVRRSGTSCMQTARWRQSSFCWLLRWDAMLNGWDGSGWSGGHSGGSAEVQVLLANMP